jgi:hypothetical protein
MQPFVDLAYSSSSICQVGVVAGIVGQVQAQELDVQLLVSCLFIVAGGECSDAVERSAEQLDGCLVVTASRPQLAGGDNCRCSYGTDFEGEFQ